MATWEPEGIDYDKIGDEDYKWDDDVIKDLEVRFNKLREYNETLNESTDEATIEMTEETKNALKRDTIELVANQIYDKLTIFFNNDRKRFGIQGGKPIIDPIREYQNFKLTNNGKLSCLCSLLGLVFGSFFCLTSGLGFTIPSPFGLTSGLSFSPSRLTFTLVPILKLGDDISILLL